MTIAAIYPGTFDPITNGHIDLVGRAARMFDRVIVAVAENRNKAPLFSLDERVQLARESLADIPGIEVLGFDTLLVDCAGAAGASVILRGLRAVSDFEFEFQMALMNRRLNAQVQTVFMMPSEQYTYISSRLIKEVFSLGGQVRGLVPEVVETRLREKSFKKGKVNVS